MRGGCAPSGTTYKLTIRRGGRTLEFDLATAEPLSGWFFDLALHLVCLIFLSQGWRSFCSEADNSKQAWLLALMLGSFAGLFSGGLPLAPTWLQSIARFAQFFHIAFSRYACISFCSFPNVGRWRADSRGWNSGSTCLLSVMFPFLAIPRLGGGHPCSPKFRGYE